MPLSTANGLVDTIRELELLENDRLAELDKLAECAASPRELAAQLLKREWLTAFQLNKILQGKGKELVLGPYVLLERIGAGGMGEVFKARHRRLHRIAAVKVVNPEKLARANVLQRFLREAEAAAKLSHPNIVAVYDFAAEGETRYLAMEYVDGVDLSKLIAQTGPVPIPLACEIIRQAAIGLHHAHEQGFVHRDVKPQNLLAAPRGPRLPGQRPGIEAYFGGTVKVLDMGLIRMETDREDSELALTQHGIVIGTLDYLSPEQARNSHHVDRRADLYSLGCTLYHLLAGRVPFPGGLPLDKLLRHQTEQPTPLRDLRPEIHADLQTIVFAMMAKQPEERFATAAEVAEVMAVFASQTGPAPRVEAEPAQPTNVFADLEPSHSPVGPSEEAATTSLHITPRSPSRTVRSRKPVPKARKRWPWVVVVMVLLLPALAAAMLLKKPTRPTKTAAAAPPSEAVDRLRDHVPPDTAAVMQVQPRSFLTAPIFRRASNHLHLDLGTMQLLGLLGVEPSLNVDWVRFCFPSGKSAEALWIASGRFDDELFLRGKSTLQPVVNAADARPGLYRYADGMKYISVGHHGDYLFGSGKSKQVTASLDQARKGGASAPHEALQQVLDHADRKKPLWLAVACPLLGKIETLTGHSPPDMLAQVFLANATTIEADLDCGEDLGLFARLQGRTPASARQMFDRIRGFQKEAGRMLAVSHANEYEKRLWLQLVQRAKVSRQGLAVTIASRVTAAMMK